MSKNTPTKTVSLELTSSEFLVMCRVLHRLNHRLREDETEMTACEQFSFGLSNGEYDAFCSLVGNVYDLLMRQAQEPSEVWS